MRLLEHLGLDHARSLSFGAQHPPLGDAVVPLDQRRNRTAPLHSHAVEVPHGGDHMAVVRVEEMRPLVAVAGEVNLADAIRGHRHDVSLGVEAVIDRAHVHVVHVEEDPAVGPFGDRREKLPLGHRAEVALAQRIGRAERQGHPVQDHRTARARSLEHGQRPAAVDHEVLRDRLEPVRPRRAIEHPREVRRSQPDAVPQIGNAERHGVYLHRGEAGSRDDPTSYPGRKRLYFSAITLPPAFLHSSALLMSTNPLPLHSFLPLQAFSAPLQLPLPLQALTPAHSTPPPVLSAARATTLPASTRAAAALAMSIPLRTAFVLPFIPVSSLCLVVGVTSRPSSVRFAAPDFFYSACGCPPAPAASAAVANRLASIVPSVPTTGASCCTRASQPAVFFGLTPYFSRSKCSTFARMRSVRFTPYVPAGR